MTGAAKAYFSCNGEAMAHSPTHRERDSAEGAEGTRKRMLELEVTRNMVEEFFGKFSCRCDAWSDAGRTTTKNVSVETACKRFVI